MEIVGYADRLAARPGERVAIHVSTAAEAYDSALVRLIHGDEDPDIGFIEESVSSAVDGRHQGGEQPLRPGSYMVAPDAGGLTDLPDGDLEVWILPTLLDAGHAQSIFAVGSREAGGYGISIADGGFVEAWFSDGAQVDELRLAEPLLRGRWQRVTASWNAVDRRCAVGVEVHERRGGEPPEQRSTGALRAEPRAPASASFLVAAEPDRDATRAHFNGKIDGLRITSGGTVVCDWDFACEPGVMTVRDRAAPDRIGTLVNTPTQAVTGHAWTGLDTRFTGSPAEYAAVHFHDDDLEDAGWTPSLHVEIPMDARSGIYAVRLRTEIGEDYVPFVVRPHTGRPTARAAVLLPTLSYLAYANERISWQSEELAATVGAGELRVAAQDYYVDEHDLLSLYDRHRDGSGSCYASRLRPLMNMRPKYRHPLVGPHQLTADLCLTAWLERRGFDFDVVTDEDLHHEGATLVEPYAVLLTGSHPEYWTAAMQDALAAYTDGPRALMYLGGNGLYWVTSVHPDRPHLIEVRRGRSGTRTWSGEPGESYHSTTGELGGLWRDRGRPPQRYVGVGMAAQGAAPGVPYHCLSDSARPEVAFVFEGVDRDAPIGAKGLILGAAGSHEIDRVDPAQGTPPNVLRLAEATGFDDAYQAVCEDLLMSDSRQGGPVNANVRADLVYYELPSGARVFSTGSIGWVGALSADGDDNPVSRITENVLRAFGA